jgi:hypothetical protein
MPNVSPLKMSRWSRSTAAVVMPRVTGRVDQLERALTEPEPLAVLRDRDTVRRHREDFAVQLAERLLAVHGDRARDQLRGLDHVRSAARVQHGTRVRQRADQLSGTAA